MKSFLLTAIALIGMYAAGAEIVFQPSKPWQYSAEKKEYSIDYNGKGWPALQATLPVKPGKFYRFTWEVSTRGNLKVKASVRRDGKNFGMTMMNETGWVRHEMNVFSDKAEKLVFRISTDPEEPGQVFVRGGQWTELSDADLSGNLLTGGDWEDGNPIPAGWDKIRESTFYPAAIVENDGYLAGDHNMLFTIKPQGNGVSGILSRYLPVEPGKKYLFSFWAKSKTNVALTFGFSLWDSFGHKGQHFNHTGRVSIVPEWRKYELPVTIPANSETYPDVLGRTGQLVIICWDKAADTEIRFDDVRFELLKEQK